jgi:ribonuclease T1
LLAPTVHAVTHPLSTGTICHSSLPPEADDTLALIAEGGPFPYRQDGEVFQNREGVLPKEPNGYYHEYTVETPGSPDRGARRIITAVSGTDYYTSDHYVTFDAIDFDC